MSMPECRDRVASPATYSDVTSQSVFLGHTRSVTSTGTCVYRDVCVYSRDGVIVLVYLYSYSSTEESNRTGTRVHYQSNRTHDYFSRLHFFHMNSCKQIY